MSSTENTNPGNFANRPTEEVKEIASMGGKASHGTHKDSHAEGHEEVRLGILQRPTPTLTLYQAQGLHDRARPQPCHWEERRR